METPRSYVVFPNGVELDIIYFERDVFGNILFSTKDGIYKYSDKLEDGMFIQKISVDGTFSMIAIDHIILDDRVKYEYDYDPRGSEFEVLASKTASEDDILRLIAKDLKLTWKRV